MFSSCLLIFFPIADFTRNLTYPKLYMQTLHKTSTLNIIY